MFDIGASELLLIVIVAIVVIGPKDMPLALRTAGRWIGKVRRVSGHFRSGIEAMIREAEMEEMEKKWREQNAQIMEEHPEADATEEMEPLPSASAEAPVRPADEDSGGSGGGAGGDPRPAGSSEPQLPLGNPNQEAGG